MDEISRERPWTVHVLVALVVISALATLITSDRQLWVAGLWFIVAIAFAYAFWKGSRWAYTWSFMLASLCVGFMVVISLVQFFLLEQTPARTLLISLAAFGLYLALLLHPATKRFARIEESAQGVTAPAS